MSALVSLVQRAAAITRPYNSQDALLLIRALSSLRLSRPEVRLICEKASFSLASSPAEVPAAVLVDAVNRLCTLQSAHLPVVQRVLLKRFCELQSTCSAQRPCYPTPTSSLAVDPRTAQKAALVLAKLGRTAGQAEATEHVLRLLHTLLEHRPDDAGLHIAYVALYVNSSRYTTQLRWWATTAPLKRSVQTLQRSVNFLLKNQQTLKRASGNVAWQLLHLLLVIPPSTQSAVASQGSSAPLLHGQQREGFESYFASGALAQKVSAGAYVQFVHSFGTDVCQLDLQRTVALLTPLAKPKKEAAFAASQTQKRLNVYDATKLASALAAMFSVLATHPSRSASFAALGGPREQHPGAQASQASRQASVGAHEAWRRAVQLCFTILCDLVECEQARLRSTHANDDALMDTVVSPDRFLVAALLDSYSRGCAVLLESAEAPRGMRSTASPWFMLSASISALLEFVPQLSETSPTMISWMLRSLASLRRRSSCADGDQLELSAAFLLRQYLCVPPKKRCLRSDVETLYAYARLIGLNGDPHVSRSYTTTTATVTTPGKPPSGRLPPLSALDRIVCEIASRLRASPFAADDEPQMEDADMLLATLLHLYKKTVSASAAMTDASKGTMELLPLLDELQSTLAAYYCNRIAGTPSVQMKGDVAVRAARLHVVAGLLHSSQFSSCRSGAALARAAERTTEQVTITGAPVASSSMLRVLAVLARGQHTGVAASLPPTPFDVALLSTLCHRYQQYMNEIVRTGGRREHVSEVVRVLWRARQLGVQLVFAEAASQGVLLEASGVLEGGNASQPQLWFPASLCYLEHLTCCAAADLLQLIAESQLRSSALMQLQPHIVRHLRMTLFEQLTVIADVECVTRLLQSNATAAVSQVILPEKEDLHRVVRCVDACVSTLLDSALKGTSEDAAKTSRHGDFREQAGRFLHALVQSQLFIRIPEIFSSAEGGVLRRRMLELVPYMESSAREADAIAVLKMKLFCGAVL
ncbi:conserved hypothetical protein [Leishmania infantum JPCM5]|uniref:Uncharacterized protein n=2 Tax=Leishmania infantum TaxID=5671 RepID=E9AHY3_LEIIN|nr:conserved hypothetical protein [Leishmania infantum JPCM5]CAC9552355.1 hypothetical_protein_-_conserved [Leishmania infantum]CBZ09041.1 conserved hypothetical protein [Leishmania infantum JPCM5]SUZ46923.1 hypothetical_protein_-_conserved [Leishmania infantum]|eukprot:XP_003392834.1 conserved hypothetical protein [Leishmania infantum JPCM5]